MFQNLLYSVEAKTTKTHGNKFKLKLLNIQKSMLITFHSCYINTVIVTLSGTNLCEGGGAHNKIQSKEFTQGKVSGSLILYLK